MLSLSEAGALRPNKERTHPVAYTLCFADGSAYVGSAVGTYRFRYYASVAARRYPSFRKNPLLINALQTHRCDVDLQFCETIGAARAEERRRYKMLTALGVLLVNCREFGIAGRWIKQDTHQRERRLTTVRANLKSGRENQPRLPDGRSVYAVKSLLRRAANKGQRLVKLAGYRLDDDGNVVVPGVCSRD